MAPDAHRDLQKIRDDIARDKPKAADRWLRRFWQKAKSLAMHPLRFEVIPEADELIDEYRHLLFGNYRIIYRVQGEIVTIVRVIRAAQLLKPRHLPRPSSRGEP